MLLMDMTQSELIQYSSKIEMELMEYVIEKGLKAEDLKKVAEFTNLIYQIGLRVGLKNGWN